MSILINKDTTVIIQGITGREAVNLTREGLDYGTKIVGGVTPGRAGRDVYDLDIFKCGTMCTRRSTSVVFPVPDGADTINSRPRRPGTSFDILDLLPHLLELGLRGDHHF